MRDVLYTEEDLKPRPRRFAPEAFDAPERTPLWRGILGRRPADMVAAACAAFIAVGVTVNALGRQSGPHPAPLFASAQGEPVRVVAPLPAPKPAEIQTTASISRETRAEAPAPGAAPRPRHEVISDIQRELARRGFYEGAVDGRHGPRTEAAVRAFETQVGLRPTGEPSEQILARLREPARPLGREARQAAEPRPAPRQPERAEPQSIAQLIAQDTGAGPARANGAQAQPRTEPVLTSDQRRILAAERALDRAGYGPLSVDGRFGADTREAVQRFQRDHRLPVTGQLDERVMRELANVTGIRME